MSLKRRDRCQVFPGPRYGIMGGPVRKLGTGCSCLLYSDSWRRLDRKGGTADHQINSETLKLQ